MPPLRLLTIAGSDSGGGAGIQADLATFAAHGAYGLTALTAVTAQDTLAVHAVHLLPPALVAAEIDAAFGDIGVDGVKIGMLGDAGIAAVVADRLAVHLRMAAGSAAIPVVLDPVLAATAGAALLADAALPLVLECLLPLATVVTPNLPELERLTGLAGLAGAGEARRLEAARALARRGPAVLAKGGHDEWDEVVDLLVVGGEVHRFAAPRLGGGGEVGGSARTGHGTGCTLSAALAVRLARGEALPAAAAGAIAYVRRAILAAPGLGRGRGPLGHPLA